MTSIFILICILISIQITYIACLSENLADCYFIDSRNESVVFVCEKAQKTYKKTDCINRLFQDDECLMYRTKIKQLNFVDCHCDTLNRYLYKTFTNLRVFDISFYGTYNLTADVLQLPNLEKLNASHNNIYSLKASVLINLKNLIEADFSFNKLTELHLSDFDGITKVNALNFSHNIIHILGENTFCKLNELNVLDLSHNLITSIEETQFKFNKKLKNLRLNNNPIKRFDGNIFWPLISSTSVSVSWKGLEEIDTSCLKRSLKINVQRDKIIFGTTENSSELQCPQENFENLISFSISGNQLQNATVIIDLLGASITILDVSSNFIDELSAFEKFSNLKYLNLSRTNISSFEIRTLFHQNKLNVLDISHNHLNMVNCTFLSRNFNNLHTLNLEDNNLTEIDTLTKEYFPSLKNLSISRNRFSCDYLTTFLQHWPELHLINGPSNKGYMDTVDCVHEDTEIQKGNQNVTYSKKRQKSSKNFNAQISTFISDGNFNRQMVEGTKYLLLASCLICCGYFVAKIFQKMRRRTGENSREKNGNFQQDLRMNQHATDVIEN